jgi:murein L,D-transpeptidase YafK
MTTKLIIATVSGILLLSFTPKSDFLTEQKKFERVRTAIKDKQAFIEHKLGENKLSKENLNILLVAYKDNDLLEVYAKSNQQTTYTKIHSYDICSRSGQLGPKRVAGDGQVPEGFYQIDRFNPSSSFYLSLGLNYPNLSDKRKSGASNSGGDIFIHGSCVTIGCMPMTNNYIKEIYLLAVYARNNGQLNIPVYVFPFKMTDPNMTTYKARYKNAPGLLAFWNNLKKGYDQFSKDQKALNIGIAENGDYMY